MNNNTLFAIIAAIIIVIGGGAVWYGKSGASPSGSYDTFTQCLADSGTTFYGAYWCPHCLEQKQLFGQSVKLLPYYECASPGNPQTPKQECVDAGVEQYPTWHFADGSQAAGVQSLEFLAEKTGCELPAQAS